LVFISLCYDTLPPSLRALYAAQCQAKLQNPLRADTNATPKTAGSEVKRVKAEFECPHIPTPVPA